MSFIASSHQVSDVQKVGGKGLHLQKLMNWGAKVAPFIVLTTECYLYFLANGKLPDEVEATLADFLKRHPRVAYRSSMIGEDALDASFAGLFETVLNVTEANRKEALERIYSSMKSDRVREYLERKELKVQLLMAVVVHAQVDVEKSGVLFTRSPVAPTSVVAIDAAFGMGEGVVSGHAKVDHYQLTRNGDLVLQVKNNEGPVLTEVERKELLSTGLMLEKMAQTPSDIEWGFKEGVLFIFQIRPITRGFETIKYFVDTNLSESYPGTVSPFTAKFVQRAYHNVFRESAVILGAAGARLSMLDRHYARLIAHVDNHLYYDLEHYYAVLRALPGGEKNIENWHKMIGGKIDRADVPRHATELTGLETAGAIFSLFRLALSHKKTFSELLLKLATLQEEIQKQQEKLKSSREIASYLGSLIERPLGFGLTVVNDVFIMMGLGLLTKALKEKGIPEEGVIDLLKTSDGVDSVKPLEFFNELVRDLSWEFIEELESMKLPQGFNPYEGAFEVLTGKGRGKEVVRTREFLKLYGDRSFEELKIESLPLKNDPGLFLRLIRWAKANPDTGRGATHPSPLVELSFLQKKVLNFTRECIAAREATRLWRGKFYHLLRTVVLKLGEKLQEEDPRYKEFSLLDFFSLNHVEWQSNLSFEEVQCLINERRPWQGKRQQYPEMIQWVESENLPSLDASFIPGDLAGQGVSPGVTEGVALVLENPNDALASELTDFILVTKNTDPAWVYIMSRSKGLVSEKGSLLSHTAIIGRELGIPTLVGVRGATAKLKTGDRIRLDATAGKIEVL